MTDTFVHEAMLYDGDEGFVDGAAAFVADGVADGDPVLVVVSAPKIRRLRERLGPAADAVLFADMAGVGANPARIIDAWADFVEQVDAASCPRGIGEPIWPDRSGAELRECQHHESLLNVAFAGAAAWWLLCPYDVDTLAPDVLDEAERSHPWVRSGGDRWESSTYRGLAAAAAVPFDDPLPPPPPDADEVPFGDGPLWDVRRSVVARATGAGLSAEKAADLALAVTELAGNSIRHGGGGGLLRIWQDDRAVVCEVADRGAITQPMVGRYRPPVDSEGGRGLWLANQLCDLVQVRSNPTGSVVRLHLRRP